MSFSMFYDFGYKYLSHKYKNFLKKTEFLGFEIFLRVNLVVKKIYLLALSLYCIKTFFAISLSK
jgi:hypothetical protein